VGEFGIGNQANSKSNREKRFSNFGCKQTNDLEGGATGSCGHWRSHEGASLTEPPVHLQKANRPLGQLKMQVEVEVERDKERKRGEREC